MLIQSRASRISDVLTLKDVDEIAQSPPGAVQDAITRKIQQEMKEISLKPLTPIASQTLLDKETTQHAASQDVRATSGDKPKQQ